MKKILLGAALAGVVAAGILIIAGVIFFRNRMPQINQNANPAAWMSRWAGNGGWVDRRDGNRYGPGMMNPRLDRRGFAPGRIGRGFDGDDLGPGMKGRRFAGRNFQNGWIHDYMVAAVGEKLGISTEDLQKRLDSGETMYEIATAKGLSADEFKTMIEDARSTAIDKALSDGKITQEQADWMKQWPSRVGFGRWAGFPEACPCQEGPTTPVTPEPGS